MVSQDPAILSNDVYNVDGTRVMCSTSHLENRRANAKKDPVASEVYTSNISKGS